MLTHDWKRNFRVIIREVRLASFEPFLHKYGSWAPIVKSNQSGLLAVFSKMFSSIHSELCVKHVDHIMNKIWSENPCTSLSYVIYRRSRMTWYFGFDSGLIKAFVLGNWDENWKLFSDSSVANPLLKTQMKIKLAQYFWCIKNIENSVL